MMEKEKRITRRRKYPYLRAVQRTLYQVQNVRIACYNRFQALLNTCAECGGRMEHRLKRDPLQYDRAEDQEEEEKKKRCHCRGKPAGLITLDQFTSLTHTIATRCENLENAMDGPIRETLRDVPIYEWLSGIWGCGHRLGASVIANIDPISEFPTISKLWAYAGMDVVDGRGTSASSGNERKWNWELHCLACEKLPGQFVKQGRFYRRQYDLIKADYKAAHPEELDKGRRSKTGKVILSYTPIHIERMTRRKLGKLFLAHLWLVWRRTEGLPVTDPYIAAIGGHTGMIEPPESPEPKPDEEAEPGHE